jgi:hypothetical protein
MAKVESTMTIARPVEDVCRHFLDLDKNASDPDVESTSKDPEGRQGRERRSAPATRAGERRPCGSLRSTPIDGSSSTGTSGRFDRSVF